MFNKLFSTIFCKSSETANFKRFDVFDGFRGILALLVVIQHVIVLFHLSGDYTKFNGIGASIGVSLLFLLSSFLLTYKIFDQINKTNGELSNIINIMINYFIRRFFRIYVPYFIFCSWIKHKSYSSEFGLSYETWFDLVTLQRVGRNHLMTILVEIRYYFFIPIFAFITYKIQRFFIIWIPLWILINVSILKFNALGLKDFLFQYRNEYSYLPHLFLILFNGSLLSFVYYKVENSKLDYSRFKRCRFIFRYICIFMILYGAKQGTSHYGKDPLGVHYKWSIYWSLFMFVLLLEGNSNMAEILNLKMFKQCGTYSFGIYLMHHEGFALAKYLNEKNFMNETGIEIIALALIISYIFGMLFYHIVEIPSQNFGNFLIRRLTLFKNKLT